MLSTNQKELLNTLYLTFQQKYNITINEFTNKLVKTNSDEMTHKDLFYLVRKVNSGYDCWAPKNIFTPIKLNFEYLKYVIETETDEYIIGNQYKTTKETTIGLRIIAFKHLMILDYDDITLEEIQNILQNVQLTFLVYQTTNGFHVYCVSKSFNHAAKETLQLMHTLKCDYYYINFTKSVGFVTRLQNKPNRKEEYIEKYITQINDFLKDDALVKLVDFKDSLIESFVIDV